MDLRLLDCFVIAAEELHFGRAAQRLDMLPSALGRNIRLLEEFLGIRLFARSTRNVALTRSGHTLLQEARLLLDQVDSSIARVREVSTIEERVFRIGAIDSASTGLVPALVHDFKSCVPDLELVLVEDKTVKLLPKLMSGALDIAFVRPPPAIKPTIEFHFLLDEPTIVALPSMHPLCALDRLHVEDLVDVPLIVPSPRTRPHSYNLTMRLFLQAGIEPKIVQQAEEKQTIVNLVGADIGAALVPYWTSRIAVSGVVYRPLVSASGQPVCELPLAAAWVRGTSDPYRQRLVELLMKNLGRYSA